jgi:hypothetical protein
MVSTLDRTLSWCPPWTGPQAGVHHGQDLKLVSTLDRTLSWCPPWTGPWAGVHLRQDLKMVSTLDRTSRWCPLWTGPQAGVHLGQDLKLVSTMDRTLLVPKVDCKYLVSSSIQQALPTICNTSHLYLASSFFSNYTSFLYSLLG